MLSKEPSFSTHKNSFKLSAAFNKIKVNSVNVLENNSLLIYSKK